MSVDTAFTLAKWSGLALIGFYGYVAARFSGASRPPGPGPGLSSSRSSAGRWIVL